MQKQSLSDRRRGGFLTDPKVVPYVFVAPFVIYFLVVYLYPTIATILMSFQEITGAGTKWIGLKNYQDLFANKNFYTAVHNSVVYMVLTCAAAGGGDTALKVREVRFLL